MRQNDFRRFLLARTTSGHCGGPNTAIDIIGQMQGHLQSEYGSMYYWPTLLPWGIDTETDRYHGQPSSLTYTF
eukprot:9038218-Pyramimonas_sp.AAC.2